MGFLDIVLGLLIAWGLYKGVSNGLFLELASLGALIAGLFGAIKFSYITGEYLSKNIAWDERYIKLTAFIITFIAIVLLVHMAGKFLTKIADFAMLGLVNKIAGGLFGAAKVVVILGALLVFFDRMNNSLQIVKKETVEESILYKPVKEVGALVFSKVLKSEKKNPQE